MLEKLWILAHQNKKLRGNEAKKTDFWIFLMILGAKIRNKAPEKQKIKKTVFEDNPGQNIWDIFVNSAI